MFSDFVPYHTNRKISSCVQDYTFPRGLVSHKEDIVPSIDIPRVSLNV